MKKFGFKKGDFTLLVGNEGWYRDPRNNQYHHLVITSNGVYFDGEVIAKGNLKLMEKK